MNWYVDKVAMWCPQIESSAMDQIELLLKHPALYKHIAIMPDCHAGYCIPIGGVVAFKNSVLPFGVGLDIGCGMRFVNTFIPVDQNVLDKRQDIINDIYDQIPVGFAHHSEPQYHHLFESPPPDSKIINDEIQKAKYQLGTLGGGNHFIELQKSEMHNTLCVMIHSGSRNFGYKIAQYYQSLAVKMCNKYHSNLPHKDLSFLPVDTPEGQEYLDALAYALDYARSNRQHMMNVVLKIIQKHLGPLIKTIDIQDVHHNYAALEYHMGRNVWVHRKGATSAKEGEIGIIPGSMGTASYIVKGLGNMFSYMSCSHGAGRKMSRTKASETFTEEECNASMEGIVFKGWGKNRKGNLDLSESPQAYKDIEDVMKYQSDLVVPIIKLTPLAVVKG